MGISQIGLNELAIRSQQKFVAQITELKGEIEKLRTNNEDFSKVTTKLSKRTIILAIVTSCLAAATVLLSYNDSESDRKWRGEQLQELNHSNELLKEQIRIQEEHNAILLELSKNMEKAPANDQ